MILKLLEMCILAPDRGKWALPHKEIHIISQLKLPICVELKEGSVRMEQNLQFRLWNDVCLKSYCFSICVCCCVYTCTSECESCSTHLVWKESFDLGSNGIKIPTDKVGEEAGCKDRKRGWVTEGESYDCKTDRGREAEIEKEKGREDIGACVSSLIYAARERRDAATGGRRGDVGSDRVNLWGTDRATPPPPPRNACTQWTAEVWKLICTKNRSIYIICCWCIQKHITKQDTDMHT